jgi:type IV pilus assembly protein PilQ
VLILGILLIPGNDALAQDVDTSGTALPGIPSEIIHLVNQVDSVQFIVNLAELPENALQKIGSFNFRDLDLKDVLRAIGLEYDINLLVDNTINKRATLRLANIPVIEAIFYLCQEYQLSLEQVGMVFRVRNYTPYVPEVVPRLPDIVLHDNGNISFDLIGDDISAVVRHLTKLTGHNIVLRNGVTGTVNGYLNEVPFLTGFETILQNNGYSLRSADGIYLVDRVSSRRGTENGDITDIFWINVDENYITLDVVNATITDVIREISHQMDLSLITYSLPDGTITARTNNLTFEQTLSYLFRGTNYTFRREGSVYIIGNKDISGIATTKLIRLRHIRADVVVEMIPDKIKQGATVQIVKEQNGLLIIGTNDLVVELESFISEIDYPTPQIMIEALVVDVQTSDIFEFGATLAGNIRPDSLFGLPSLLFGGQGSDGRPSGGLVVQGDGSNLNKIFATGGNLFGIQNLGVLPDDFYFKIQALSQDGIVNIRSRPQISTLNGHTASIEIGTKQYFILRSTIPIRSSQDVVTQESERFEIIEANVSLKITPWVSASGEVTTEIRPEFNTPVGALRPDVPPTINSRVLDSTVRLKDGETIILGGLIQESESETYNRIPFLGSIPLIGKLFSNRSTSLIKSELIIFITPHVFYGDGNDAKRWQELRDEIENK